MFTDKTAIVTGGSRGIGAACAIKLAKEGADIAIFATSESAKAKETIDTITKLGRKAKLYVCDVSNMEAVTNCVNEVVKDFSHIDILINCAGVTRDKLLLQMSGDDIDAVIDTNLKGCMYVTKACVRPFMRQKSGKIVNIASVVGLMGNAGQTNYAASKAGVIGFTKSVAKEYAAKNITCNAIAPGFICTDMTAALNDDQVAAIKEGIPAKRFGEAGEVASLAAFLVSDAASYITGDVIKVDGGMYI